MKIGNLSLLKLIGKGTMGEIYLSSKKDSKEYYATKKIKKENADRPQVKKYFINEISILKKLKHNKIVRLIDLKQTPSHYYIVMEYCNGGSLLNCLRKYKSLYKKPFSEEIVQFLMRQIVRGLKYIHEHGIIHRDIKLDNILVKFYSQEDINSCNMLKTHIKISDFGISAKLGENKLAFTALGSPAYMDPFILKKLNERNDLKDSEGYDQSADIWSLGAMCYEMLIGKRIFTGRNLKELFKKVEGGDYTLPTHLSQEVVSFLNGMLQYDSKKRLTIEELSRHHFLTKNTKDFSSVNFALVSSKLGVNGININTKKNDTLWNIFNEDTEVKLNSIPTRILDLNTYPDNSPENEVETQDQHLIQNKDNKIEEFQSNEKYPKFSNYNDISNNISNNQISTKNNFTVIQNSKNYNISKNNFTEIGNSKNYNISKNNFTEIGNSKNYNISKNFKEDKRINNFDNFNKFEDDKNNFSNTQIQLNPQNFQEFNNDFSNATTDYNINNINNIGNNTIFNPYPSSSNTQNINQNVNVPFYGGHTINPQMNDFNLNQQNNPNYPGDIKVQKKIATTEESCLNQ